MTQNPTPEPTESEWLTGGNMTAVERIGETVHRTAGPWTPTIHRLLQHLHDAGIDWVPRPLGLDDSAREVLSHLRGEVPNYPLPDWIWTDDVLVDTVGHLSTLHDATADHRYEADVWQFAGHDPAEVICHNDFAPYNLVFDPTTHAMIGAIDWDTASPGPRVWDLAYLAYRLVPLTDPTNSDGAPNPASARRRRLDLAVSTYGRNTTPAAVLTTAIDRLDELAGFTTARANEDDRVAGHADLYRTDAAWIRAHLDDLL